MRIPQLVVLSALCVGVVALTIYWPGLHGAFFFDDGASILTASGVRLTSLTVEALREAWFSGGAGPLGRPISQITFAINHYFAGFDPFTFKATNLAIHLVCGGLVFKLTHQVLAHEKPIIASMHKDESLVASAVVATLWLLHPIQLLPVLHVVQRMTSLSALFLLAGLVLHIQGRGRTDHLGTAMVACAWGLFWPLSVLSKETGLLFPAFVLSWELVLHRWATGRLDVFARLLLGAAILATIVVVAYMFSAHSQWIWSGYDLRPFGLIERMLTEGRVLWFYLGLIAVPRLSEFGLHHDDIAVSKDLLTPLITGAAMSGIVGLVLIAWLARRRSPLISFGIVWFLIGHMMESTVLPLEIAHEHRNYLPLFGVLMTALGLATCIKKPNRLQRSVGMGVVVLALLYFPFVTALRAHQFGSEVRRAQMEAQNHPTSPIAQHEAGLVVAAHPDSRDPHSPIYISARQHFDLATAIDPDFKIGLLGLIDLDCKADLIVSPKDVNELARRLAEGPFAPGDRNVLYMLKEMSIVGKFCLGREEMDRLFAAAISNPTVSPSVKVFLYSWQADYLWLHAHDLRAAKVALQLALDINPSNPSNRLKWAQLLLLSGKREQAEQLLRELKNMSFPSDERTTLNELLASVNIHQ